MSALSSPFPARRTALLALAALTLGASGGAGAATIDLSGAGGPYGFGNTLQFSAGGITVDVYAWAETGALQTTIPSSFYAFETAELQSWSTGIGICNRMEGATSSGCDTNEHEIDTVGRDDLIVLFFNQVVSFDNLEVTVDPWDGVGSDPNDRDLRYWISTVGSAPDLSTQTFNTLSPAFGAGMLSNASSSYNAFTHLLHNAGASSISGDLLLISGDFMNRNCTNADITQDLECEAWKLKSVVVNSPTQVVPVPAAVWLLGSALGCLGLARRRSA